MATFRITERLRFGLPQARIEDLRRRTATANEQLTTGRRINRPSDDPLGALRVTTLSTDQRKVDQFERNLRVADANLRQTDGVLGDASEALYRVKELTIQSLTSVVTQADADSIANEIAGLRDHLRSLANTRLSERYLFGGFRTDVEPYDVNGVFGGTPDVHRIEASDQLLVDTTIGGGLAFGDGTPNTVDVFDNLIQLEAAIRARIGLGAAGEVLVQDELERLELSIEQVVDARAQAGIAINRVQAARGVNAFFQEHIPAVLAEVQDTDFTKVITELTRADNGLQATLAASGRTLGSASLLDFLS